jgi:hypothetical protein
MARIKPRGRGAKKEAPDVGGTSGADEIAGQAGDTEPGSSQPLRRDV